MTRASGGTSLQYADASDLERLVMVAIRQGLSLDPMQLYKLKEQLNRDLPILDAFERYKNVAAPSPHVVVRAQPLVELGACAAERAEALHVLHEGGRPVILDPPESVGETDMLRVEGLTRPVFVACFSGATAFARSSTVQINDGTFVFDVSESEMARVPADLSFDPVVMRHDEGMLYCIHDRRPSTCLHLPEALALFGTNSANFGHWMIEELTRFLGVRHRPELARVPILIDANLPPQHRESLMLLAGPERPVIEVPRFMRVRADRLWVASNWFYSPKLLASSSRSADFGALAYAVGEVAALHRDAWAELACKLGAEIDKADLFLSRDPKRYRHITNHTEVVALLARMGHAETRPETLSFREQLLRYRRAESVVAQGGSAQIGVLMCPPGTNVYFIGNGREKYICMLTELLKALGHRVRYLAGEVMQSDAVLPDRSNYRIDPQALLGLLSKT